MRRTLYWCAWAVIRHDSKMRRFYDRLRQRGKPSNVSVVAAMRKILLQLNAVARPRDALGAASRLNLCPRPPSKILDIQHGYLTGR